MSSTAHIRIRTAAMVVAAVGIVLLAVAALVGCSAISSGTITAKDHEPRRMYVCSAKPLIFCTDTEDWRFDITDGEQDGYVYVTPEEFEQYAVGDYYGEQR